MHKTPTFMPMRSPFFYTPVPSPAGLPRISPADRVYMAGSCFSENIAQRLAEWRFHVLSNSHGIIFNPISLAASLQDLIGKRLYAGEDLEKAEGGWVSLSHHGKFRHEEKTGLLNTIDARIIDHSHFLARSKFLFVTFGSAWAYEWKDSGKVVANCHKLPAEKFTKRLLTRAEIVDRWSVLLADIGIHFPELQIIFTVSPVKHLKDGIHENLVSKSLLLLAIHELQQKFPGVFYYPAYEMMTEELRDYRFYEKDGAHPNALAIDHIFNRFTDDFFDDTSQEAARDMVALHSLEKHWPVHEATIEGHQQQIARLREKLIQEYPFMNWESADRYTDLTD